MQSSIRGKLVSIISSSWKLDTWVWNEYWMLKWITRTTNSLYNTLASFYNFQSQNIEYCNFCKSTKLMFKFSFTSTKNFEACPNFKITSKWVAFLWVIKCQALHQPTYITELKNIVNFSQNIIISYSCPNIGFWQ